MQELLNKLKAKLNKAADSLQEYNVVIDNQLAHKYGTAEHLDAKLNELQGLENLLRFLATDDGGLQDIERLEQLLND